MFNHDDQCEPALSPTPWIFPLAVYFLLNLIEINQVHASHPFDPSHKFI
jgi:hypothetical protein